DGFELLLSGSRELAERLLAEEASPRAPDPLALTTGDWQSTVREIATTVQVDRGTLTEVSGLGGLREEDPAGRPGAELVGDQAKEILDQMEAFQQEVERQQSIARASYLLDGLTEVASYLEDV